MTATESVLRAPHRRRAVLLAACVVALAIAAASDVVHELVAAGVSAATAVILRHAVAGAILFLVLSALSAMVVFFSTAVITPVAIDAYGSFNTVLLLWSGWIIGGITAFWVGRFLGRPVIAWFVKPQHLEEYETRARGLATFSHVLLFQLAVPSEIPGYVLGLSGCPFRRYAPAMILAELPFAIGAVYLGASFLNGNYYLVIAIGLGGIALTILAGRVAGHLLWNRFRHRSAVPAERVRDHAAA